jgi:hemolysin III
MIEFVTMRSPNAAAAILSVTDEIKPLLRGWFHAGAVIPAAAGAAVLVVNANSTGGQRAALTLYGAALVLLFGISALYHCAPWPPRVRAVWRRLDHANIFVMIAATYTAIATVVLDGGARVLILAAVWGAATIGIVAATAPIRVPRAVMVVLYLLTGWMAVVIVPAIAARVDGGALVLLFAGGLLYSAGALAYALQRPRLWPRVFGYHEVFHLLVIAATALFFTFVAISIAHGART